MRSRAGSSGSEPFTARLNPDLPSYDEYDQLMRLDEWMAPRSGRRAMSGNGPSRCKDNQASGSRSARNRLAVRLGRHRQDAGAVGARAAPAAAAGCRAVADPVPHLHQGRRGGNGRARQRSAGPLGADGRCRAGQGPRGHRCGCRSRHAGPARAPCLPACSIAPAAASGSIRSTPSRSGCFRPFPKKPGLTPGTRAMEDRDRELLAREVLSDLLLEAENRRRSRTLDAHGRSVSVRKGPDAVEAWLMRCAQAREAWFGPGAWHAAAARPGECACSGFAPMRAIDDVAALCADDAFDVASLRACMEINRGLEGQDRAGQCRMQSASGSLWRRWRARPRLGDLHGTFFTAAGKLRASDLAGKDRSGLSRLCRPRGR